MTAPRTRTLVVAFAVVTIVLVVGGRDLVTESAPLGIVSFQFAGDVPRAAAILASWSPAARRAALWNLAIDFPYLAIYASLLARLCRRAVRPERSGTGCARLAFVAAGADACENLALLHVLLVAPGTAATVAAWLLASVKFTLLGLVLIRLAGAAVGAARRR